MPRIATPPTAGLPAAIRRVLDAILGQLRGKVSLGGDLEGSPESPVVRIEAMRRVGSDASNVLASQVYGRR